MLKIEISKRAEKFIRKLPAKQKRQIITKIMSLRLNSEPHDSIQLKGHDFYRRTDIGEYRIIYYVRESVVLIILLVGKRNHDEVYKQLKRI
ncbi:MAG: type II toxin-antitoxin system RelE/ParE family toxin [Moraxellaceae bacterium]|nr:type II toxin-antitoxin system RelE/ParE family toxin [Pseudobdellovibrionaceae bacterium]